MSKKQSTRREVIKKAVYVTPAIMTLPVLPSFAATGSGGGDPKPKPKPKPKP